jgi:hypothetical protein
VTPLGVEPQNYATMMIHATIMIPGCWHNIPMTAPLALA